MGAPAFRWLTHLVDESAIPGIIAGVIRESVQSVACEPPRRVLTQHDVRCEVACLPSLAQSGRIGWDRTECVNELLSEPGVPRHGSCLHDEGDLAGRRTAADREETMSNAPQHRTVLDADGVRIHAYVWEADRPRAVVHILHGVGEHAQRYAPLARRLQDEGFTVVANDHRGHGATGEGDRGLGNLGPRAIRGAIDAAESVSRATHAAYPDLPLLLLGHSWGSFMAQKIVARSSRHFAGLILSGTSLGLPGLTRQGNFNAPWAGEGANGREWLSRDQATQQQFADDPWCFDVDDNPVWSFAESTALAGFVPGRMAHDLPVLIQGGDQDSVGGSRGSRLLAAAYQRWTGLTDVTTLMYPGARHEIFNETNRDDVQDDLVQWLRTRF